MVEELAAHGIEPFDLEVDGQVIAEVHVQWRCEPGGKPYTERLVITSHAGAAISSDALSTVTNQLAAMVDRGYARHLVDTGRVINDGTGATWQVISRPRKGPTLVGDTFPGYGNLERRRRRRITPALLEEVAGVYNGDEFGAPTRAVMRTLQVSKPTAARYVKLAREAGLIAPHTGA